MYFENSENGEGHLYFCMISHIFAIPSHNVKREQVFALKNKKKEKKRRRRRKSRRRRRRRRRGRRRRKRRRNRRRRIRRKGGGEDEEQQHNADTLRGFLIVQYSFKGISCITTEPNPIYREV